MESKARGVSIKGKKPQGKGKSQEEQRDSLKAVVIADTFQDRYMPFAVQKPRCLLPLANTPLIDYTLEFLSMSGVEEVYIYAGNHSDQVKDYVENHARWGDSIINPFEVVEFVPVANARSMGDFLRDLDKRGKMTTDFILVHGDLIANIDLDPILDAHRARRKDNRDAIMTTVLRTVGPGSHRAKMKGLTPIFQIDVESGRCLGYDEMTPYSKPRHTLLDLDHILKFAEIDLRADLIDPGIDICTPDALALWAENYDYELPRKHFLHGVLKDFELNGKMIYAAVLDQGYAARANNLQMYAALTQDVQDRYTDPFIPTFNLMPGQGYRERIDRVAMEDGVTVGNTTKLERCVIGSESDIEARATISNSIIGKRCKIGRNVVIKNSFIWDDVVIEDGSSIEFSVIADRVHIGKNCTVPEGSLISFDVRIDNGVVLVNSTKLSTVDRDGIHVPPDTSLLGPQARGARYTDPIEDEEAEEDDLSQAHKSLIYLQPRVNLSAESVSTFNSSPEESDDEQEMPSIPTIASRSLSAGSDSAGRVFASGFHLDAVNGILDTLRAESTSEGGFDSTKLEFTGLRLATDASDAEVRRAVAVSFAKRATELLQGTFSAPVEAPKAAQRTVAVKGAAKFLQDVGVGGEETERQVLFILALQQAMASMRELDHVRAGILLTSLMQQMYHVDVLSEDGIVAWWHTEKSQEDGAMAAVRQRVKALVDWLEEDDDEEETDEED